MNVTRALIWASRGFFGLGLVLFASLFAYMATRGGSGELSSSGETVSNVSAGEMHLAAIAFAAIAWSFLTGGALRTLAQSTSWPRALLSIADSVGFGVIFLAPIFAVSGRESMAGALACFLAGFAIIIASRITTLVAFGAKEAAASASSEIARVKDIYRQAQAQIQERNVTSTSPSSFAPQNFAPSTQTFMPAEQTFMPEPPSPEPQGPARSTA